MIINPEFKRNVWQELTRERLIAMPIILISIFWISYLQSGPSAITSTALFIMFVLLVGWGTGLAADSISSELRDHTWEAQRMTPLGPFKMTWGKLLGSTIFVWYGALICLLTIIFSNIYWDRITENTLWFELFYYLLTGILVQALAFFTAILFQRISPIRTRARITLIQIFIILIGIGIFYIGKDLIPHILNVKTWHPLFTNSQSDYNLTRDSWYNLDISNYNFILFSQLFFIFWLMVGIYRLLRFELQIKSYPIVLVIFYLFLCWYLIGFLYLLQGSIPNTALYALYFGVAYLLAVGLAYLSAFFTPKNVIYTLRLIVNSRQKQWKKMSFLLPGWCVIFMVAVLILLPLIYFVAKSDLETTQNNVSPIIGYCISLIFFFIRDVALLYFITWNAHAKRAHLAAFIYLIALYTILPMILVLINFPKDWLPVFTPWAWFFIPEFTVMKMLAIYFWIALQGVIALFFAYGRLSQYQKKLEV